VLVKVVVVVVDETVASRVVEVVVVAPPFESAVARLLAMGVPHPVTGSHPTPAEYPLLEPEVTSWNIVEYEEPSARGYNSGLIIPNPPPPFTCNATPRKPAQRGVERLVPAHPNHPALAELDVPHKFDAVEYTQKLGL
jgi:hypothetical protein